jgi:hypothetical protein
VYHFYYCTVGTWGKLWTAFLAHGSLVEHYDITLNYEALLSCIDESHYP